MPRKCGQVLSVLLALCVFGPSSSFSKERKHSTLSEITIDEVDNEIVVGIRGTKLPDFTSFMQRDPHLVIVDWAGSVLGDVPANQPFERNLVRAIRTEQFSTESEKISRVTVELALNARYRFETSENEIFIRFIKVPIPQVEIPKKPRNDTASTVSSATQQAIDSLDDWIPKGPLTEPAIVPAPPGTKKVLPLPQKLLADFPDAAAKPKPIPQKSLAKETTKPPPTVVALARVSPPKDKEPISVRNDAVAKLANAPKIVAQKQKDPIVTKEAPLLREVEAAKPKAKSVAAPPVRLASSAQAITKLSSEKVRKPNISSQTKATTIELTEKTAKQPETKIEKKVVAKEVTKDVKTLDKQSEALTSQEDVQPNPPKVIETNVSQYNEIPEKPKNSMRLATVPAKEQVPASKPEVEMAPSSAKASRTVSAEAPKQVTRLATVRAVTPKIVSAPKKIAKQTKPAPKTKKVQNGKVTFAATNDAKPGRRVMKYIGFRQKATVSEVFIRCDGKAKFRVVEQTANRIVVKLENTTIRLKNNQRALDTSFFPTAVQRVQAKSDAKGTRVEIALSRPVPYEVKRVGSTIKLLFNNAAR